MDMGRMLEVFSARLREARLVLEYTQAELGAGVGVSREAISRYETGRCLPGPDVLLGLADILGAPVEWFFGRDVIDRETPAEWR